ncbi:FecR family protein [Dyadobacter sp. CY343]|uniref:FecR family protein n=1 Tax=Dyadobacter sp. CY343 TaxID=2907299 RepID=UPI001F1770F6|nr:FecR family protein [Dyadobacter sp. CY343]MCE7060638.1 FecR domain-containing protein [Dyadobacter sp. CY343]
MKNYKDYNLEDFLLDDSFRLWITRRDESTSELWEGIVREYPDKKVVIQQAGDLIRTWTAHSAGVSDLELEEQVQRILAKTTSKEAEQQPVQMWKSWVSAAAAMLVVGFGIGWYALTDRAETGSLNSYSGYVAKTSLPLKEVINGGNKVMLLTLPEGSRVKLHPKGRISYSAAFVRDKKREVYLSGEAFFDVVKDAQNPFFVYANGLATRVLGTSFRVRTTSTNVEVLVRSGRVSVLPIKDIDHPGDHNAELLLTPNQQAIFSVKDHVISKSITNMPLELIKTDPEEGFVFENQPVSKIFSALEKVYGIPIVYDASVMENCSLRVELSHEPFFVKLDVITQTIGAAYRVSDGQVIVTSEGCR